MTNNDVWCEVRRAGTSLCVFMKDEDLPSDAKEREAVLLRIIRSGEMQALGVGGESSLTRKMVVISPSEKSEVDIDYLVYQVNASKTMAQPVNCGNALTGVGPYAIEHGLIETGDTETIIRMRNVATGMVTDSTIQMTLEGVVRYDGEQSIDGVSGTAAPIYLDFINPGGITTEEKIPTGGVIDIVEGVEVTCLNIAMPMVIVSAEDMGKTGHESKPDLDQDDDFMRRLEEIRRAAALKMGFGDVSLSVIPKMCMVSHPVDGGAICSRYFTAPGECHPHHAVTGAIGLAAATLIPGSVANKLIAAESPDNLDTIEIKIEHPSGKIPVHTNIAFHSIDDFTFPEVSVVRTTETIGASYVSCKENVRGFSR